MPGGDHREIEHLVGLVPTFLRSFVSATACRMGSNVASSISIGSVAEQGDRVELGLCAIAVAEALGRHRPNGLGDDHHRHAQRLGHLDRRLGMPLTVERSAGQTAVQRGPDVQADRPGRIDARNPMASAASSSTPRCSSIIQATPSERMPMASQRTNGSSHIDTTSSSTAIAPNGSAAFHRDVPAASKTAMTLRHVVRQRGSAFPGRRRGSPRAATVGDDRHLFEFGGYGLVGPDGCRSEVPSALVRVGHDLGQRGVRFAHRAGTDSVADGRTHQWMHQFDRLG